MLDYSKIIIAFKVCVDTPGDLLCSYRCSWCSSRPPSIGRSHHRLSHHRLPHHRLHPGSARPSCRSLITQGLQMRDFWRQCQWIICLHKGFYGLYSKAVLKADVTVKSTDFVMHDLKLTMPKPGCALIGGTMEAPGAPGPPGAVPPYSDRTKRVHQQNCLWDEMWCHSEGRGVHADLTMGAPGVPQLVGATCGIQLAPPVSFFSLCGSLKEIRVHFRLTVLLTPLYCWCLECCIYNMYIFKYTLTSSLLQGLDRRRKKGQVRSTNTNDEFTEKNCYK